MPTISTARFTERIKFFDGQRLFASDLQELEQFNREMRWLHNRSLHQAGVASGYAVSGNKDDREVTIQPGYAVDNSGREIVLTQPEVLQVPPVANDGQGNPVYYDLAVSYPDDARLKETETRDGICVSRSAVRLREKPVFCWVELASTGGVVGPNALAADHQPKSLVLGKELEDGVRIRLARAEVLNCKLNQPLSVAQRRNAKPSTQPFLYAGRTSTVENRWIVPALGATGTSSSGITIALKVDTSSAQFRTPPRYFAHAIGVRELTLKDNTNQDQTLFLDGFMRLYELSEIKKLEKEREESNQPHTWLNNFVDESADDRRGFVFSLLIPAILIDLKKFTLEQVANAIRPPAPFLNKWYVEWMGVEG
ncbi:MAG TPA: hypothetical protein VJ715_15670 [Pyrinomonadaceae bacterium]|nr:hypothetical protein [Pyrinomonadaceae bacterium]